VETFLRHNSIRLSVCPFVCLSVRHTRALWRNDRTYCRYFDITWKGNHSIFVISTEVGGWCPFHLKFPPAIAELLVINYADSTSMLMVGECHW